MKEASIKVPKFFNSGDKIPQGTIQAIEYTIIAQFSGFTRRAVSGVWRDDKGLVFTDELLEYDIAADNTLENNEKLLDLARQVKAFCAQDAVYVRLFDGQVVFV